MLRFANRRYTFFPLLLFAALLLGACQPSYEHIAPDYAVIEEAMRLPRGAPLQLLDGTQDADVRYERADETTKLNLQRLDPPEGSWPLGMIDARYGYLLDEAQPQVLWRFDYQQRSGVELIDYRGSSARIAREIAFNENWLIWLELGPYRQQSNGLRQREVRLMARDLQGQYHDADIVIDQGSNTPAEGFYLPFDSLSLDDATLVYRASVFQNGQHDTRVKVTLLDTRETKTLASASGAAGRQIHRCSIDGSLIVWDVRSSFSLPVTQRAALTQARYSLYCYQLKEGNLRRIDGTEQVLTQNDDYYEPVVYGEEVFALRQFATRRDWIEISTMPSIHRDNDQIYRNIIVRINPAIRSALVMVRNSGYSAQLLEAYALQRIPVTVQRDNIHVGKRLLSWQSNIGEQRLVYDMLSFTFLELPVYFELSEADAQSLWVQPIRGLDADYLLFGLASKKEPPYLLRLE